MQNSKTTCTKKNRYAITSHEAAKLAGCSESYVRKIRRGIVDTNTDKARLVLEIDALANEGLKSMIDQISKLMDNI